VQQTRLSIYARQKANDKVDSFPRLSSSSFLVHHFGRRDHRPTIMHRAFCPLLSLLFALVFLFLIAFNAPLQICFACIGFLVGMMLRWLAEERAGSPLNHAQKSACTIGTRNNYSLMRYGGGTQMMAEIGREVDFRETEYVSQWEADAVKTRLQQQMKLRSSFSNNSAEACLPFLGLEDTNSRVPKEEKPTRA
jgi:hypothetical protein